MAMLDPYTVAAVHLMTNRTERERRETEQVTGRMAAAVRRLVRIPTAVMAATGTTRRSKRPITGSYAGDC
jgi:hypothetical protein